MSSELLFASYAPKTMQSSDSIGNKFVRLLGALQLAGTVKGKRVAVKMHLGGGSGFTTIHPFFVRKLVTAVREAGAASVFITDLKHDVECAVERGYTEEVCGCPLLPVCGEDERGFVRFPVIPPFKTLDAIELSKPILDADVLIDFSHVKGHGVCGFGGASKNLSMGAVTGTMRRKLHSLEGGLNWDRTRCTHCGACVESCPEKTMEFNDKNELHIFFHNCKYCRHCVLICPQKAIEIDSGSYVNFQRGMAMTSAKLLEHFKDRALFINMLMDVTLFCDCWGMTTPRLIRDIGILAGRDIVAIEQASLNLIDREPLIPGTLPPEWNLDPDAAKPLFQRLHHKNPYVVVRYLEELGCGSTDYTLREIE